jgi:hypothetical protein
MDRNDQNVKQEENLKNNFHNNQFNNNFHPNRGSGFNKNGTLFSNNRQKGNTPNLEQGRTNNFFQSKINSLLDNSDNRLTPPMKTQYQTSQYTEASISNSNNSNSNYFYFKLFDSFGEDLDNSTVVYKNMFKVKLFKDETASKLEKQTGSTSKKTSDKDLKRDKINEQTDDFFGPQKNRKKEKERNFKPY